MPNAATVALVLFLLILTAATEKGKRLAFVSRVNPPLAMSDAATGGAVVSVTFRIEGEMTEAWYCPRLDVEWPDETRTMRESDCEPWPDESTTWWSFKRGFPPGEWKVRGCISKAGKTLACTDALVRVAG
jgi:hypothetical protein